MMRFQIIAHGCHFRVMFKTKGFSSNNSLKRRAVIVDAPDLPPEECEFYITNVGIADTDKVEMPETQVKVDEIKIDQLYEDSEDDSVDISLTDVKGIGKGSAENLINHGITTLDGLVSADPEDLSKKINGVSSKMITDWQNSAKALLEA